MSKADVIEVEGKVVEKLPNAMFQVELENGVCLPLSRRRKGEFYQAYGQFIKSHSFTAPAF